MKEYNGAVLFVDILGISALTTSEKPLVNCEDFAALSFSSQTSGGNQLFCAHLLSRFRKNLQACGGEGLRVAQFSDCAFLWSESASLVVHAAKKIFQLNTEFGILARGGMAFGQIIEPDKIAKSLGDFICGGAVTRAAKLEGAGKGARVFIDREIGGREIDGISPKAFSGMPNPSDYRMIDEFLWFSCPSDLSGRSEKVGRLKELVSILVRYKSSPMFRWNAASSAGRTHLGATVERLSKATFELCDEIEVKAPHFATQTSELFQETYADGQHSNQEYEENLAKFRSWSSQV